jgi:hypothetical protein
MSPRLKWAKGDERGFPSVVNGKINLGAVSQATHAASTARSSAVLEAALALERIDSFF